ncbi:MAG: DUF4920 domain-containing protein [Salibacteraceae bacterium]
MKKIFLIPALISVLFACSEGESKSDKTTSVEESEAQSSEMETAYFGAEISGENAISTSEALAVLADRDSINTTITGQVQKVCQVKGCWMTMEYGEGESMRVSFRDYGFFVPKDIDGKEVVIDGTLHMETTSVDDLRHYAEDEGLSEEEVAAITEPETALSFVADGVIVKNYKVKTGAAKAEEQNHEHDHDHGEEGHEH